MLNIVPKLLVGGIVITTVLGAMLYDAKRTVKSLTSELTVCEISLEASNARFDNIVEDRKSDAEVDNLSDADLRVVPDEWLR